MMVDKMIDVCIVSKCSKRTYFLAVRYFDLYLVISRKKGIVLTNKDVELIGFTAIYIASQKQDIFPIDSKEVSEEIAHNKFSSEEILTKESEFLQL